MRTLGVILAGGRSSRFGSDKALALLDGRPLLEHAVSALRSQCDVLAIAGRQSELALALEDWPGPNMGPLGGLAAALRYAEAHDFDQVISVPVDCVRVPHHLRAMLEPAPACLASQPVIGLWPAHAATTIANILTGDGSHAVRAFADAIGARAMAGDIAPNINVPADLARLETHHGL